MLSKQKLKVVVVKAVLVMVVILVVGGSNYKVELTFPLLPVILNAIKALGWTLVPSHSRQALSSKPTCQ